MDASDMLLIHSQSSTAALFKFGRGWIIPAKNLLGVWLIIQFGIKVKPS